MQLLISIGISLFSIQFWYLFGPPLYLIVDGFVEDFHMKLYWGILLLSHFFNSLEFIYMIHYYIFTCYSDQGHRIFITNATTTKN
jgi:hypothetical protein